MKLKKRRILLIDDDVNFLSITKKILVYAGIDADICADPQLIFGNKELGSYDLIISDLVMPQIDGIEVLKYIKQCYPYCKVIILTGNGTIDTAVEAIKLGAYTYIEKPMEPKKFIKRIQDVFLAEAAKEDFLSGEIQDMFVGRCDKMLDIKRAVGKIARVDSCVLITGNSGTGKEVIANMLHQQSCRKSGPFIKVNCAAIPDTLFESELFGFEKGSFTGAQKDRRGKIELADKGTLFLDEVGDLSLIAQTKILRAIQEKEISRLGSECSIKVDFRLICATNKNLKEMVKEGKFREDLYYRINVASLEIPPLKERKEDIPAFIEYFCKIYEAGFKKHLKPIGGQVLERLLHHSWPGNVRELKNVIERFYIFTEDGEEIHLADLPTEILTEESNVITDSGVKGSYRDVKYEFERSYLVQKLKKNQWNISNTAREIGLSRRNLHEKINQFGLKSEELTDE